MANVMECIVGAVLIAAYVALIGWVLGGLIGLRVGWIVAATVIHLALPVVWRAARCASAE